MKTSLFALYLLLFVHAAATPGRKTDPGASYRTATPASAFWPHDTTVTVYFVRGLFTVEQQQTLRQTLETWTTGEAKPIIRFSYAGEAGGLIDCLGCLTLTRQELYTKSHKRSASFNRLRSDHTGHLISAWVGFDNSVTDPQKLRTLLVQVLDAEQLPRAASGRNTDLQGMPTPHK